MTAPRESHPGCLQLREAVDRTGLTLMIGHDRGGVRKTMRAAGRSVRPLLLGRLAEGRLADRAAPLGLLPAALLARLLVVLVGPQLPLHTAPLDQLLEPP